ncbi:hypothetical protein [Gaetbulibacter saemankumensis]|uniref:hypothetical protein n=1 Tax=Gaetbulibacter saemankumensis TaxID=311208 RepID=UPI0004863D29|nr:hypothetical protein [Gaetbulibacter saemankumensis]
MKNGWLSIILILLGSFFVFAQETYTYNGEVLILKMEIEGDLDFLVLKTELPNRYFIKDQNDTLYELINTQNSDNSYNKEYKATLNQLTIGSNVSARRVGFGRYSIKEFIRAYNSKGTKRFEYTGERASLSSRIAFFAGITNHPFIEFVDNRSNTLTTFLSSEFEFFGHVEKPKQAGFFSIEHAIKTSKLKFSATQITVGYRYRFINQSKFNVFGNLRCATYTFTKETFELQNDASKVVKESLFHTPLSFGIGADIKLTNKSYLSFNYNELFAIFMTHSKNFPVDIAFGYKLNL